MPEGGAENSSGKDLGMGWLDTPDLCYTDAVTVLAAATHRPVRVVLHRGRRVVRVDFEFGRFLLAQNHDTGTTTDPDASVDSLDGRRAWVFAGLGNPEGFVATVTGMGLTVVGRRFWPDHHTWTDGERKEMALEARDASPDVILTTEKDAVKLPPDRPAWPAPLRIVRIGIEFLDEGSELIGERIRQCLASQSVSAASDG